MERAAWTNERLDDLAESMRAGFARVDQGFARVDQDIRDLRAELNDSVGGLRAELNDSVGGLRAELNDSVGGLRAEMREEFRALHALLLRIGGGIIVALIGVIAAILARGV